MSHKNNKTKRFVIIMSIFVIVIILIGTWLTWKIVEDGMNETISETRVSNMEMCNQHKEQFNKQLYL